MTSVSDSYDAGWPPPGGNITICLTQWLYLDDNSIRTSYSWSYQVTSSFIQLSSHHQLKRLEAKLVTWHCR